ncbi:MAG TPA: PH domain-containing protein [Caulobacteraceae bacterium]|jgi:uncharacterized membrane protein YdbT with pleckstrin-like domain|nr:PH domain-containing protein [Caulobacteraceae bacterium]
MGYVERMLGSGETVTYRAGLHWIIYGSGLAFTAVAIGVGIGAALLPDGRMHELLLIAASVILVLAIVQLLTAYARSSATEIAVTTHRIIYKSGLLSVRSVEMNRDKVESVIVDQDLLGRMLDYGTVIVRGTGAGLEPVVLVSNPLEFRRQVSA